MKKNLLLLAFVALSASASAQGKFNISGMAEGADGKLVYLQYGSQENPVKDSTVVKKGKFAFKGKMDAPYYPAMAYVGNPNDYQNVRYVRFSLEPTKMTVALNMDDNQLATASGGKTQTEDNELNATIEAAGRDNTQQVMTDFVRQHPDSYLAPYYLRFVMGHMDYAEVKGLYDSFTPEVKQYGDCKPIEEEIASLKNVQPGCTAPNFTANDIDGKPFTLSSLRGKVVIIDFWASWCKPCRESNPHMRELYRKYHPKGLQLVYVSDDDSKPEAWHKAVDKDKLTGAGYHHVLRGMKWDRSKGVAGIDHTNDISHKFAIHYLPTKYLIDQQGCIVCKIDEGQDEKLDKELERLLGKAEYSFTIEGTIQKAEGQNVSLSYGSRDSQQTVNTTISGGKFQLKGVMDNPYYAAMLAIGEFDPTGQKENNMAQLALEPGTITIDCPTGRLDAATIKGGKTQDEMNALNQEMMPVYKQLMAFNKQYYAAKNDKQREAVAKKMTPVQQQYGEIVKNFYKSHPDSYLSPQYYAMELGSVSYEDIKKQYEAFSEDVRLYSPEAKEIASELANLENVQPGHEAPDFTAKDINGKDFTMSSLKGKVVIIDFWASWCVPCRKSNPHMLELYRKYHDQGLEMVYVSDDDSNPDAWRKAVEKDGLTGDGFHHVLRGFKMDRQTGVMDHTNDISDKYAVHFLPTKYLIDREGKIVCKIAEGEDAKIDELIEGLLK